MSQFQQPYQQPVIPAIQVPTPAVRSSSTAVSSKAAEALALPLWIIAICHVVVLLLLGYWMIRITMAEVAMRDALQNMGRETRSGS